jgi:hypothetical protein
MNIYDATETAYKNGYAKGYADGKGEPISCGHEKGGEWISVNERLPKEGVRVLVWLKGDNSQYTSIDTDRLSLKKWVRWGSLVTHWMPLPNPPKGE